MEILEIQNDLIQFNSYFEPINMSFNQFLLLGAAPPLVHTGTAMQSQTLLSPLINILKQDTCLSHLSHQVMGCAFK
jgi:hypothetical protein